MNGSLILNGVDAEDGLVLPAWLAPSMRQRLVASRGILVWGEMPDDNRAAIALVRMDWDCNHFNSLIGEIIIEMHGSQGADIVSDTLPDIIRWACIEQWQHISVHVDGSNSVLADIIGRSGFWLADTKLVYRRNANIQSACPRLLFSPRAMVAEDTDQVLNIIRQADFPSRFSRDQFFSRHRVTDMHLSWLENILKRPTSEQIACVAECDGHVMAFAAAESVSRPDGGQGWSGYSRALAAGDKSACGAALSAVGAMTSTAQRRGSNIECVVSAHNPAAVRGLTYLGYQLFGKQLAFHRHIDSDSASSRLSASSGSV